MTLGATRPYRRVRFLGALLALFGAIVPAGAAATLESGAPTSRASAHRWRSAALDRPLHTRMWTISYRAHTGRIRAAYILLPRWYGPRDDPPLPLVISPHGRGVSGLANARVWGDLPGIGGFAVANPDGEGDHLGAYSWGAPGQIADLARMPELARASLPWLRLARGRIYAIGGSMGGQETLLLLGEHPRLLAGAAAFDPVADFAHQYAAFARLHCVAPCPATRGAPIGPAVQRLARVEVGGDPAHVPGAYAARSPINYARAIAGSCVPLELWWSTHDRVVLDPRRQALGLLTRLRRLNPTAPVEGIQGTWVHSAEMHPHARLPFALARLGLLPSTFGGRWGLDGARDTPAPTSSCSRRLT